MASAKAKTSAKTPSSRKEKKETEVLYVTQSKALDMCVAGYTPSKKLADGRLVFRFKKSDMERLKNHYRIKNGELIPYEEPVNAN